MPKKTAMPIAWRISGTGSGRSDKRQHAQDEREGGHQDRSETQPRSLADGLNDAVALIFQMTGDLDDQDGVLGGRADENDEADLGQGC